MGYRFIARPYRYADNVRWNDARMEIFQWVSGEWVPVGGFMLTNFGSEVIAFVCSRQVQRKIHTPKDVEELTGGMYVRGNTVLGALRTLKWKYPNPVELLREQYAREMAAF